jgi:hypothetical protein
MANGSLTSSHGRVDRLRSFRRAQISLIPFCTMMVMLIPTTQVLAGVGRFRANAPYSAALAVRSNLNIRNCHLQLAFVTRPESGREGVR